MMDNLHSQSSELLHLFMDGELDPGMEQDLFSALLTQPDLRSELKDMLTIRSAVGQDFESFVPPPALTASVFQGISAINGTAIGAAKPTPLPLWTRLRLPLVAILSSVTTIAVMLALRQDVPQALTEEFRYRDINETSYALTSAVPHYSGDLAVAQFNESYGAPRYLPYQRFTENVGGSQGTSSIGGDGTRWSNGTTATTPENPLRSAMVQPTNNTEAAPTENATFAINNVETRQSTALRENPFSHATPSTSDLTDGLITMQSNRSLFPKFWMQVRTTPTLGTSPTTGFGDNLPSSGYSLLAAYAVNDNVSIGVEVSRESFGLEFEGLYNGRQSSIRTFSPMVTGGAVMQYRADAIDVLSSARPFVNLFGGASSVGLLGRIGTGLQLPVGSALNLVAGVDYGYMMYQYQSRWFNSSRYNFSYGLMWTF